MKAKRVKKAKKAKKAPAKRSKKKRLVKREPARQIHLSPEWRRACEDIASAYGAAELACSIAPFGVPELAEESVREGSQVASLIHRALVHYLPDAMDLFDAAHPPCSMRSVACMRGALMQTIAIDRFDRGVISNPSIEFRVMKRVVEKYLNSLS